MSTRPRARLGALIVTLAVASAAAVLPATSAQAIPIPRVVTFDTQGGLLLASPIQVVLDGGTAHDPGDPTKLHNTFDGWFDQASGGSAWDFATPITASRTIYAHWTLASPPDLASTVPAGQVGVAYFTDVLSGTDATAWVVAGAVPGLTFAADGTVSGTPTSSGSFPVVLSANSPHYLLPIVQLITVEIDPGDLVPGAPTISGTPIVGETLTADPGTWSPTPDAYDYTWLRDGVAFGATGPSYTTTAADDLHRISVTVTAHRASYNDLDATSTGVDVGVPPVLPATLAESGTNGVAVADTVTATGDVAIFTMSGDLPPGVVLSPSGAVTGTPTHSGTYVSTITATNAWGSSSTTLTFTVVAGPLASIHVTSAPDPADIVAGDAVTVTVTGSDGYEQVPTGPVTLTTDDPSATVDNGAQTVTFTRVGSFSITAAAGGFTGAVPVTVVAGPPSWLTITPSATHVAQGGSLSFTVTGTDAEGNPLGDLTAQATFSSDYASDVVSGATVTFPHASPHVITATVGRVSTSITVQVIPTAVTTTSSDLASTGVDAQGPASTGLLAVFAGLVLLGAAALRRRVHR